MATSPQEYRQTFKKTIKITLPSGAEFEIRPFGVLDLAVAPVSTNENSWLRFIFPRCILNPKVVDKPKDQCKEDELSLDDISPEDQAGILKEIGEKSQTITENFFGKPADKKST